MKQYVVTVKKDNGVNILINAKDKSEAIYKFTVNFNLFDKYNWKISVIDDSI